MKREKRLMIMADRSASAVMLGFNFEINAAIVLMLENIVDLQSVRAEGEFEDIDIRLNDGSWIFAQAKAVVNAESDFSHVHENLRKALVSLSEAERKAADPVNRLVMVTNSINPLNDTATMSCFYGHAHKDYRDLPDRAKNIIDKIVAKAGIQIDLSRFRIQVIPFVGDDENERYKVVREVVKAFLGRVGVFNANTEYLTEQLLEVWQTQVLHNGSTKAKSVTITKAGIVWPLLALLTDVRNSNSIRDNYDPAEYEEIIRAYGQIISHKQERFEFYSRVLYDYRDYAFEGNGREKTKSFVATEWKRYLEDFQNLSIGESVLEIVIKITIESIVNQRIEISRIKERVRL